MSPPSGPVGGGPRKSKPRQAAGWRGLSVDLITNPEEVAAAFGREKGDGEAVLGGGGEMEVDGSERLEGRVVKMVWTMSGLERGKLREIW